MNDLNRSSGINKRKKPKITNNHLKELLESSVDGGGVGTLDLSDQLAASLAEVESGHGGDGVLGSDGRELVDVDLVEVDGLVGLAQLLEGGADGLAGTAPGGEEVNDDGAGGVGNLLGVFFGANVVLDRASFCEKWLFFGGASAVIAEGFRRNLRLDLDDTHFERGRREAGDWGCREGAWEGASERSGDGLEGGRLELI